MDLEGLGLDHVHCPPCLIGGCQSADIGEEHPPGVHLPGNGKGIFIHALPDSPVLGTYRHGAAGLPGHCGQFPVDGFHRFCPSGDGIDYQRLGKGPDSRQSGGKVDVPPVCLGQSAVEHLYIRKAGGARTILKVQGILDMIDFTALPAFHL